MSEASDSELLPVLRSMTKRELFAKVAMFSNVVRDFDKSFSNAIDPNSKIARRICGIDTVRLPLRIAGFELVGSSVEFYEQLTSVNHEESALELFDMIGHCRMVVEVGSVEAFVILGLEAKKLYECQNRLSDAIGMVDVPPFDGSMENLMWDALNLPLGEIPGTKKTVVPFWECDNDWWNGEIDWNETILTETASKLIQENAEWVERHGLDSSGLGKLL